jgi:hypothetical protein
VAPYLGRYAHPTLGEVTVALRGGKLLFDAGEVWLELRPLAGAEATYLFYAGPLGSPTDTVTFRADTDGRSAMVLSITEADGEALTYPFESVAPATGPSP